MKRCIPAVLFAALFISACSSSSNGPEFTTEDLQSTLTVRWHAYTDAKPNFPAGLAMQIISPKGEYFISTDMGPGMSNGYHFRIASCTKTFTAAAIMLLHQQGRLDINDIITDNIPGTNTPYVPMTYTVHGYNQITIKMLLMHRAGVYDITNSDIPQDVPEVYAGQNYCLWVLNSDPNHQFGFDELVGVNAKHPDLIYYFEPGSSYHYSNTGFSILGKIIERVSGQTYQDFITSKLLTPNGLTQTSVPVDALDKALPAPFSEGYRYDGPNSRNVTVSNMSLNIAEGNIISTPKDLSRWWWRQMHGEAGIRMENVEMMMNGLPTTVGGTGYYGMGIDYSSRMGYGHNGAHEGYLTNMYYFPDKDVLYVMYSNAWDESTDSSMMDQLLAMIDASNLVLARMGY
jgi:D-alanyl-D-alanine carboxypeptidase